MVYLKYFQKFKFSIACISIFEDADVFLNIVSNATGKGNLWR